MSIFICQILYIWPLDEAFNSNHYHEQSGCKTKCCHIFIENYNISSLSCYNGFLNGNFETKVRQNGAKKNISIRNIKLVNMNPIKTAKTSIIDYTRYYTLDDQIKI